MMEIQPTTSTPSWPDSRPADWSPGWVPPPRWGTPRRSERKSLGPAIALTASKLGTPLKPFQRHIVDVAHELDPETNTLAYGLVVLVLPRQSGKTVLTLPRLVTKGRLWRGLDFVYTAQDRNYALRKLEDDFVGRLDGSKTFARGKDYRVRLGNGKERISFPATGSKITIAATQATSGHGGTYDDVTVDEAFSHDDATVDSGFAPPQITRGRLARESMGKLCPGPQLWVISASGTEDSHYFDEKCRIGREAVERGDDRGVCFIEWSCPADWDIADRSLWWYYIPGLGHLVDEQDIAADFTKMGETAWRRAYASQPERSSAEPSPISVEDWGRLVDPSTEAVGRLVYGVAVSVDRQRASIGMASDSSHGGLHVELIDARPGTLWVAEELISIVRRSGGAAIAIDPGSPAGSLLADIEVALRDLPAGERPELIKMSARDHAAACGALVDRVSPPDGQPPGIRHGPQPELDAAVAGAKKRPMADAWALDRKKPDVDVSPLESIVMALGGFLRLPAEVEETSVSVYESRGFVEW